MKVRAAFFVVVFCVLSVLVARRLVGPLGGIGPDPRGVHRSKGDPGARLSIVEYVDYECAACRKAWRLLEGYTQRHPSELYIQARFYPVHAHRHGWRSALYAECAARQGRFWPFQDILFEKQPEWAVLEQVDGAFHDYAHAAGMDIGRLDACLDDSRTLKAVEEERAEAQARGVKQTPTFFVGGKMIVGVRMLAEELERRFPDDRP